MAKANEVRYELTDKTNEYFPGFRYISRKYPPIKKNKNLNYNTKKK
jgi:hypothetical protein